MTDIVVSIICNTYNQEKYIRDALEGFVNQQTNFKYEVLIHDDASTDSTPDIIKEYERNYPDIIKPIFQKENQYSKGVSISNIFQYPRARGKYIAFCEGDDYWIDNQKLQLQIDLLEKNPSVDMCAHASRTIDAATGETFLHKIVRKNVGIISVRKVMLGGGDYVATASLLYRRKIIEEIPAFRKLMSLDYTLQIHGSLNGGMLYIPREMSVYRSNVSGSWTNDMRNNMQKKIKHMKRICCVLKQLDKDTLRKYHFTIQLLLLKTTFKLYVFQMCNYLKRN